MNNFDRNTRTLIVSFLIAVFALVPLRFIEVGQQQEFLMESQVLGEIIEEPVEEVVEEVVENISEIEPVYEEVEECMSRDEFEMMTGEVFQSYDEGYISREEAELLLIELANRESNICP